MTPPQVPLHNTEEDIIEIIQSVEPVSALKGLISSIVGNATDIIPLLQGYQITAASCRNTDVDGPNAGKRRCYLQVDINKPNVASDNAELTVISDDSIPDLNLPMEPPTARRQRKGKNKAPTDVLSVRRSDRLVGIKAGFYDDKSVAAANLKDDNMIVDTADVGTSVAGAIKVNAIRPNGEIKINLEAHFEAEIINSKATPPPHLPIETIQTIGTSHCKLPSPMVTREILNGDSSDDCV
jgi:hypothetical protein